VGIERPHPVASCRISPVAAPRVHMAAFVRFGALFSPSAGSPCCRQSAARLSPSCSSGLFCSRIRVRALCVTWYRAVAHRHEWCLPHGGMRSAAGAVGQFFRNGGCLVSELMGSSPLCAGRPVQLWMPSISPEWTKFDLVRFSPTFRIYALTSLPKEMGTDPHGHACTRVVLIRTDRLSRAFVLSKREKIEKVVPVA